MRLTLRIDVVKGHSLVEVTATRYNPNYGPQSDFEGHARDGPQRRQKGREKGSEEARRVPHSRAAEPNRAKSSKDSVGERRKEKKKVLNYEKDDSRIKMKVLFEISP